MECEPQCARQKDKQKPDRTNGPVAYCERACKFNLASILNQTDAHVHSIRHTQKHFRTTISHSTRETFTATTPKYVIFTRAPAPDDPSTTFHLYYSVVLPTSLLRILDWVSGCIFLKHLRRMQNCTDFVHIQVNLGTTQRHSQIENVEGLANDANP